MQKGEELPDPSIVDRISEKLSKYDKFIKINLQQVVASNEPIEMSLFNGDDNSVDFTKKKLTPLDFEKIKFVLNQPEAVGGSEEANK